LDKLVLSFQTQNEISNATRIDFLNTDDQKLTSAHDICNTLNEYFSTTGLKLNQSLLTKNMHAGRKSNYINQPDGFSFAEVDSSVVAKTLTSLKNNKNGGLNQIPAFIYKILEPLILAPLTYVINLSITKCVFLTAGKRHLLFLYSRVVIHLYILTIVLYHCFPY
jgi:hypothetical protein